jgi:hypothetical protein
VVLADELVVRFAARLAQEFAAAMRFFDIVQSFTRGGQGG